MEFCYKEVGDNTTILHDVKIPPLIKEKVKEKGKEAGGPWECHEARNYFGWESDSVVAVTSGAYTMEQITRAKSRLFVIIVEGGGYASTKEYFKQAKNEGLVDEVDLGKLKGGDNDQDIELVEETTHVADESTILNSEGPTLVNSFASVQAGFRQCIHAMWTSLRWTFCRRKMINHRQNCYTKPLWYTS